LSGSNFRASAEELSKSLQLDSNEKPTQLTAIPFYFLVSHAAELYLKAALLKRGFNEADLKKFDYRHNLDSLLTELQKKGVSISQNTANTVKGLNEQHKTHILRYTDFIKGVNLFFPTLFQIWSMLDELFSLTKISTQGI